MVLSLYFPESAWFEAYKLVLQFTSQMQRLPRRHEAQQQRKHRDRRRVRVSSPDVVVGYRLR